MSASGFVGLTWSTKSILLPQSACGLHSANMTLLYNNFVRKAPVQNPCLHLCERLCIFVTGHVLFVGLSHRIHLDRHTHRIDVEHTRELW
jgi:hypothetical protein